MIQYLQKCIFYKEIYKRRRARTAAHGQDAEQYTINITVQLRYKRKDCTAASVYYYTMRGVLNCTVQFRQESDSVRHLPASRRRFDSTTARFIIVRCTTVQSYDDAITFSHFCASVENPQRLFATKVGTIVHYQCLLSGSLVFLCLNIEFEERVSRLG